MRYVLIPTLALSDTVPSSSVPFAANDDRSGGAKAGL